VKEEILDKNVLWEGRFLRSLLIKYRNLKGNIISWEAFDRVEVKGIAVIVPFTRDDEIILTKQFRPPVNKYVIEFPAGLNDQGESLEEVARRELLEETGYEAESLSLIAEGPLSSGASSEILTVFLATDVQFRDSQRLDEVEEIEVMKVPVQGFYGHLQSHQDNETYLDLKIFGLYELAMMKRGLR
jgi:8-oxo-dGTP pyrophosphatase MutT (NUDIX family)